MRRGITLAAGIGLALTLTACSSGTGTTPSATPTVDSGPSVEAPEQLGGNLVLWVDDTRGPAVQAAAEKFTTLYGTTFEFTQKDFESLKDEFISQAPSGAGPDVSIVANDWLGTLVQNGVLEPVDLAGAETGFVPVSIQGMSVDGQLYGVPYTFENVGLVRNTDLVPDAPTGTFDDLITLGDQLIGEGKTKYPVLLQAGPAGEGDPWHTYAIQSSFGSTIFGLDEDGNYDPAQLTIGDEAGVEFAKYLATLGERGVINKDINGDMARDIFAKGEAPFMITGSWYLPDFDAANINYAVSEIPSAGGQPSAPFVGVQGFVVNSYSENKIIAAKFLEFLGTEDAQTTLFEVGKRAPALQASLQKASSDPVIGGFGLAGANGQIQPAISAMGAVWGVWGVSEFKIFQKQGDPVEVWSQMADDIAKAIADSE